MPIDYVIPFVDSSDREWVGTYRKYAPTDCSWSSNATRFRDWDLLRYQLRSISRHLPWIHRIYIVLSVSEGQVPRWLNRDNDRVRVVWDWEFIPREYLPTFNSNVIDLFIPRIEGISEHYLLGCVYRDLRSAPRALEEYQRAVSQADTTRADCDLRTLLRIHSQMALLSKEIIFIQYNTKIII